MRTVLVIALAFALAFTSTGCAGLHRKQLLGAQVHTFNVGGIELVHCSILMDKAKPQQAHDAIEVCRDELQTVAQPAKR